MVTRRRLLILGGALAAALASPLFITQLLEGRETTCDNPPILYGRDECPVCKMIVDYQPSSSAMYVEEFGRRRCA